MGELCELMNTLNRKNMSSMICVLYQYDWDALGGQPKDLEDYLSSSRGNRLVELKLLPEDQAADGLMVAITLIAIKRDSKILRELAGNQEVLQKMCDHLRSL